MKKIITIALMFLYGMNVFSQEVEDSTCLIHMVQIDEPTFFAAIDTLINTELENGITNPPDCAIHIGLLRKGLFYMSSSKKQLDTFHVWAHEIDYNLWGTFHKKHLVVISDFTKEELPEWIRRANLPPLQIPCRGDMGLADIEEDGPFSEKLYVQLIAQYLYGRITILLKNVGTQADLTQ